MPGPRPQKNLVAGGWNSVTCWSGGGATSLTTASGPGDFTLWSGNGRLDSIMPVVSVASGLQLTVVFYDAAVATSGGPYFASGHKIVGQIPAFVNFVSGQQPVSGNNAIAGAAVYNPVPWGMPFQSGLCVAMKSGQSAWTISLSPEIPSIY